MATIYLASGKDRQGVTEIAAEKGIDFPRFEKEYGITFLQKPVGYVEGLKRIREEYAGKNVMVIDDEEMFHNMVTAYLDRCVVRAYENPREAVKQYRDLRPDVVITDLQMPEMDGFDVIKAIRELEGE